MSGSGEGDSQGLKKQRPADLRESVPCFTIRPAEANVAGNTFLFRLAAEEMQAQYV
jgi:hypothetical protein